MIYVKIGMLTQAIVINLFLMKNLNDKTPDQSKREQRTNMGLVLLHAYGVTKVTNVSLKITLL